MEIHSQFAKLVYFRLFDRSDTTYSTGFHEGYIENGWVVLYTINQARRQEFKIEFKEGGVAGPHLPGGRPGSIWSEGMIFTIGQSGNVSGTYSPSTSSGSEVAAT
jgi:hypothetical protein